MFSAYLQLCKPRVVALMLVTAFVGMLLAVPPHQVIPLENLFFGMLGIALSAASAAAINHIVDQNIDVLMNRTQRRPIPTGQISTRYAIIFASILALLSMLILILFVNVLTAVLTSLTLVGYAFVYSLYLKHATPQNIVIGGIAGAAPPLLGWVAITGHIHPYALLLVLIIFAWTPPHFWALAVARQTEYARAEVPMLPVTHGVPFTKLSILLYTWLLFAVTLLPFAVGMSGIFYLINALWLGAGFVYYAWRMKSDPQNNFAIRTFYYSIFYLFLLFVALLLDHYF